MSHYGRLTYLEFLVGVCVEFACLQSHNFTFAEEKAIKADKQVSAQLFLYPPYPSYMYYTSYEKSTWYNIMFGNTIISNKI